MRSASRNYWTILFFLLLIWAGVTMLRSRPERGPRLGELAPDFSLKDAQGQAHNLSGLRGKVVLLNLWETSCDPCRREIPSLEALYQRYSGRNFTVLAVSLDADQDAWGLIASFQKKSPMSFPVLWDDLGQVAGIYQVVSVPESFLIDASGRVVEHWTGEQDFNKDVFQRRIESLLK